MGTVVKMGDSFFRGTTSEQDPRFKDKQKKLLKSMKFPKAFSKKVDINKVEMKVIKPWIAEQIKEKLGFEDDVLIEYVYGMLGEKEINPKVMQINLTGFLEAESAPFMLKLWKLLLSAQENAAGIPEEILENKKEFNKVWRNTSFNNKQFLNIHHLLLFLINLMLLNYWNKVLLQMQALMILNRVMKKELLVE